MRSYHAHRRLRVGVIALVATGVAVPILAHAFASTPQARIEMTGRAAMSTSKSTAAPSTALPDGTAKGDFLVSYIETSPSSTVTCAPSWIKRLDVVNGTATRLVACTHLETVNVARPIATLQPAAHASMITLAFSNVDLVTPVANAAAATGLQGPSVPIPSDHSVVVLAEGSPHWRVDFAPPADARKVGIVNDGVAGEVATAIEHAPKSRVLGARRWTYGVHDSTNTPTGAAEQQSDARWSGPTSVTTALVLNLEDEPVTTTTSTPPSTTSAPTTTSAGNPGGAPTTPPAEICGNHSVLDGPASPPAGAVIVPAGDNHGLSWNAHTTYWFAPGTHTLGTGEYDQIIPADNDTFVGAPGAIIDGQHKNDFAFTQHAANVTVQYLTIKNFVSPQDQGVVNHDSADGWTIANNTIVDNEGAALMAGADQVVRDNCIDSNGQYGINVFQMGNGITSLTIEHNEIADNNTGNWEKKIPGCGCTGGLKLWAVRGATITDNYVHDNHGVGVWADTNNVGVEIGGNYISGNDGEGIMYEVSYNGFIHENTLVNNVWVDGPTNPGFPTGAIYISESGGDARVSSKYSTFEISGNVLVNNWSGVILWENADRFCHSPANPTSDCTKGGQATPSTCVAGTIDNAPYYSDCRWKTQNVQVHDNEFELDSTKVPGCSINKGCGLNGIFSQWGTYPSWSPYQGQTVENAIMFHQNNVFSNNTYTGTWRLMAHDQGTELQLSAWQASPYNQDQNSSERP